MSEVRKQIERLLDLSDSAEGMELAKMERYDGAVLLLLEISGREDDEATAARLAAIADALESTSRAEDDDEVAKARRHLESVGLAVAPKPGHAYGTCWVSREGEREFCFELFPPELVAFSGWLSDQMAARHTESFLAARRGKDER